MDILEIYVDRLDKERQEQIACELPATALDIVESDLKFEAPVQVTGKAYIANDHLVLKLSLRTLAIVPCAICNDAVEVAVTIDDFYHTESLTAIRGAKFDALGPVREAILLEVPQFVECGGNSCPRRAELAKFLTQDDAQFPFAELDRGDSHGCTT